MVPQGGAGRAGNLGNRMPRLGGRALRLQWNGAGNLLLPLRPPAAYTQAPGLHCQAAEALRGGFCCPPFHPFEEQAGPILPLQAVFQDFLGDPSSSVSCPRDLCPSLSWKCCPMPSGPQVLSSEEPRSSCLSLLRGIFAGSSSFPGFSAPDDGYSICALFTSCALARSNLSLNF